MKERAVERRQKGISFGIGFETLASIISRKGLPTPSRAVELAHYRARLSWAKKGLSQAGPDEEAAWQKQVRFAQSKINALLPKSARIRKVTAGKQPVAKRRAAERRVA